MVFFKERLHGIFLKIPTKSNFGLNCKYTNFANFFFFCYQCPNGSPTRLGIFTRHFQNLSSLFAGLASIQKHCLPSSWCYLYSFGKCVNGVLVFPYRGLCYWVSCSDLHFSDFVKEPWTSGKYLSSAGWHRGDPTPRRCCIHSNPSGAVLKFESHRFNLSYHENFGSGEISLEWFRPLEKLGEGLDLKIEARPIGRQKAMLHTRKKILTFQSST